MTDFFGLIFTIIFIILDVIIVLFLFVLFGIYSSMKIRIHWNILAIGYLIKILSDMIFFASYNYESAWWLRLFMCVRVVYLGFFIIGSEKVKKKSIKIESIRDIQNERVLYRSLYEHNEKLSSYITKFAHLLNQEFNNDFLVLRTSFDMFRDTSDAYLLTMAEKRLNRIKNKLEKFDQFCNFILNESLKPMNLDFIYGIIDSFDNASCSPINNDILVKANELLISCIYCLVENANQHGGKNTKINIEIEEKENRAFILVKDDGTGVPDEEKKEIFKQDYDRKIETKEGLNLYMAKIIIDSFGGKIWVKDNQPHGSVFVVELKKWDKKENDSFPTDRQK
ncbi:MAG: sensor histidine kinase [Candidatus Heimdallarchaeaceae archaeon]